MTELPEKPMGAILGGRLQRDYILPYEGNPRINVLGGSLPYLAAAYAVWGGRAGLSARVNPDYPLEWLDPLRKLGFDTQGVQVVSERLEDKRFIVYTDPLTSRWDNPLTHFAERQIPFPHELLGFSNNGSQNCSKFDYEPFSTRIFDIPRLYQDVSAAHIAPIDYVSHKILPSILKAGMIQTLNMRACTAYMNPTFWEEMRSLISDLTAFMCTEGEALQLFQGKQVDLVQIARLLAGYGPEFVLIHKKDYSVLIYDRLKDAAWLIPAYPGAVRDPTGVLDAFDGAFLFNYRQSFDVLEAALCASVTASKCMEGFGPYYLLDTMPGLLNARLEVLRPRVVTL